MKRKIIAVAGALLLLAACASDSPTLRRFPPEQEESIEAVSPPAAAEQEVGLPPQHLRAIQKFELNEDVVGWLHIPDTGIDEAVLYKNDDSNEYYLHRDFSRNYYYYGSYFADFRSVFGSGLRKDLARNTSIYGYGTDDMEGIRFSQLKKYTDPEFAAAHPYIYFSTLGEDMAWEVFAVFYAHIDLPYNRTDIAYEDWKPTLQAIIDASIYDYGTGEITEDDKFLTLTTGAASVPDENGELVRAKDYTMYRFVVMARLIPPGGGGDTTAEFTEREVRKIAYK